jgi:hypothetical protein
MMTIYFFKKIKAANLYKVYLTGLLFIFLFRWSYRLLNATLWAEDGTVFLHDAFKFGFKSLFISYEGYYHTLPRIVAYVVSLLPTIIIPHVIVFICFIITFCVISNLLNKYFEWILPDIHFRGILMLLIAIAPGTSEAFGNIANIHWVLYLYLGLLGIRSIEYKFKIQDYIFATIAIFSEGAVLTFLPLFLIRIVFHYKMKMNILYYIQESFMILVIVFVAFINFQHRTDQSATDIQYISLLNVYFKSMLAESISFPWLYVLPYTIFAEFWIIPSLVLFCIATIVIRKFFTLKANIILPIVFLLCFWLLHPLIVLARNENLTLILTHNDHGWTPDTWLNFRYSFLICSCGYIYWIWIISFIHNQQKKIAKILSYLIIIIALVSCVNSYLFLHPRSKNLWIRNSKKIDDVRNDIDKKYIEIPIEPASWKIKIGNGNEMVEPE